MRTTNSLKNRLIALVLGIVMVLGVFPIGAAIADDTVGYGAVSTFTGGYVKGNGTANVEVVI